MGENGKKLTDSKGNETDQRFYSAQINGPERSTEQNIEIMKADSVCAWKIGLKSLWKGHIPAQVLRKFFRNWIFFKEKFAFIEVCDCAVSKLAFYFIFARL
jgi:hypothetical protein